MIIAFFAAGILVIQAGSATLPGETATDGDVAYEQLIAGEMDAAIIRLEAALLENPGDPALLINLGSAYAETGNLVKAAEAYRAAADSSDRYLLELAGGHWVDSRTAARRALRTLEARGIALR